MILVDTSVWIDHLHATDVRLVRALESGQVLTHAVVLGEIALGRIAHRGAVLDALGALGRTTAATDAEALALIERRSLTGSGIGWADVHLIASVLLTPGTRLWTRDRRLRTAAEGLDILTVG